LKKKEEGGERGGESGEDGEEEVELQLYNSRMQCGECGKHNN
jgi:hypothetical protein